ncbi:hypothetical protein BC826DRAFT_1012789 [Russula brevipes]|nr:hypothetical protein BC826DRAFT_1012789 [Russula brevipes]
MCTLTGHIYTPTFPHRLGSPIFNSNPHLNTISCVKSVMCPVRDTPLRCYRPSLAYSHLPLSFAGHPESRERTPRPKQLQLRCFLSAQTGRMQVLNNYNNATHHCVCNVEGKLSISCGASGSGSVCTASL